MRTRLDVELTRTGVARSRSQAENLIRLGSVSVNGQVVTKPGFLVAPHHQVTVASSERYVSRAGLKLASVAAALQLDFRGATVLDVGSSTGGFTDYALQHGARKVVAIDVGTDQLHPSLCSDERIQLHEKTDIRSVRLEDGKWKVEERELSIPDIIVIDVSFISVRDVLSHLFSILHPLSSAVHIVAMVKPQFEAGKHQTNKGVIKNEAVRRQILADFEQWARQYFVIVAKRDSDVAGAKGNRERFYLLTPLKHS